MRGLWPTMCNAALNLKHDVPVCLIKRARSFQGAEKDVRLSKGTSTAH